MARNWGHCFKTWKNNHWRGINMVSPSSNLHPQILRTLVVVGIFVLGGSESAAKEFSFINVTDLPGGPGQGSSPSINDQGDVSFHQGTSIFFFDNSAKSFLDVTALPGAPAGARFPKLNNLGNIAMIETTTDDFWVFEAATQAFTNVSSLLNFPGNSGSFNLKQAFDLNDSNKMSFHSGDRNTGTIHLYDHGAGSFTEITSLGGGPTRGRENVINNADQVGFMGFPSLYVYDPATNVATNISTLPGGPGGVSDNFAINDLGDAAIFFPDETVFYDASVGSFLSLSTLPGWPTGAASSGPNDLSDSGEITFWRTDIHHFDPVDQSFSQLTNKLGATPAGGHESSINDFGQVAFAAGFVGVEDIFLGNPISSTFDADFDGDSDVDGNDLADWNASFGINAGGDSDADGDTDGSDFLIWQREFGNGTAALASQSTPVPEGSTLRLLVAAMIVLQALACSSNAAHSNKVY